MSINAVLDADEDLALELPPALAGADIELNIKICLLYTSDAADERSSVDLGGRRIIKKKKDYNRLDSCML